MGSSNNGDITSLSKFESWRFWACLIVYSIMYLILISCWHGYQYLTWICKLHCWVYKICSVVSGLYPYSFHWWCIFRLVDWISHLFFWFCCHVEEERWCYQVQSWWRTYVVDYVVLTSVTHWELYACSKEVILMSWMFLILKKFDMTWLILSIFLLVIMFIGFLIGYGGEYSFLRINVLLYLFEDCGMHLSSFIVRGACFILM